MVHLVRYVIQPTIAFVTPEVEAVKARVEEGSAFLDFPVNQTKIYPEYRNNPEELKKIIATIDLVKNDKNTRITEIDIEGYASPEGSYKSNARLAQGRAEALKKYVQELEHFEQDFIKVTSVPEDWEGLRNYVANSTFAKKDEMLAIIDNDKLDYDARELRLRTIDGGSAYTTLLNECYPALRHSDYKVQYVVRGFSVDEAKEIMTKRPQQLSLNEMFQVAQTYESGSDEFNEVFEVAVRMFPDDPTANINAAAIELQQGNWKQAEKYLLKSDPQAGATKNNEGVMWMMQGSSQVQAKCRIIRYCYLQNLDINCYQLAKTFILTFNIFTNACQHRRRRSYCYSSQAARYSKISIICLANNRRNCAFYFIPLF